MCTIHHHLMGFTCVILTALLSPWGTNWTLYSTFYVFSVQPIVTIELRNLHVKCAMCLVGFARFDQQLFSYGSLTDWLLPVTCTSYLVRIPERTPCVLTPRHVSGQTRMYWCTSALSCLRDMSILWSLFSAWRQPTLFYPSELEKLSHVLRLRIDRPRAGSVLSLGSLFDRISFYYCYARTITQQLAGLDLWFCKFCVKVWRVIGNAYFRPRFFTKFYQ
jgi:hypothetical protein